MLCPGKSMGCWHGKYYGREELESTAKVPSHLWASFITTAAQRVSCLSGSTPASDSVLIIWCYATDYTKTVA